jgi:myotubularin-related protein 14
LQTISNKNGELCPLYPTELILIEYEKSNQSEIEQYERINDPKHIKDSILKSRNARCRGRFPFPGIFFNGKHICRSATLSGGSEIFGRSSIDFLLGKPVASGSDKPEKPETAPSIDDLAAMIPKTNKIWQLHDHVRKHDIKLLRSFGVQTIVNLMLEKKKVKFGVYVTSSEQADAENRYKSFDLLSLPYPGCEHVLQFGARGYSAEGLMFNWGNPLCDAPLTVPVDAVEEFESHKVSHSRSFPNNDYNPAVVGTL